MTNLAIGEFVSALHEPAAVATVTGIFQVVNDAFRDVLQQHDRSDARKLEDIVDDTSVNVSAFLKSCALSGPAVQFNVHITNGQQDSRFGCYGSLLHPGGDDQGPLVLLRFYHAEEPLRRFKLLGRKIKELNTVARKRRGVQGGLRDIQRTLEHSVAERTADLERANRELVRSNQSLEEFAYVASHDLREPLRKITVFGDMLMEDAAPDLSERNLSVLTRMVGAARRLDVLIESLLEYSRVSTTAKPFSTVDLNRIVHDVVGDLEILVRQTDAAIEVDPLPVVKGDETQMRQLFQNVISNSLKFRKPDRAPLVRISSDAESDLDDGTRRHIIEIRDNGIGFEREFAEQIFDPFRRLNPRHKFDGTGIGLAVCRRIVERHGGQISATGEPDQGATFRISLPVDGAASG